MFSFLSLAWVILITNNLSSVLLFNWLARRRSSQGALDVTVIIIITNATPIILDASILLSIEAHVGVLCCGLLLWLWHRIIILWRYCDLICIACSRYRKVYYDVTWFCRHHFLRIYVALRFSCISSILFKFTPQQEAVLWVFRVLLFCFQLVHWGINQDKTTFKMKEMSMSRNSPKAEIQKVLIFSATSNETLWQTI